MTNHKILLVGKRPGNLGQEIHEKLTGFHNTVGMSTVSYFMPSAAQMDLTDETDICKYVALYGPFDQIVYAAGVNRLAWIKDLSMQELMEHFQVNVFGLPLIMAQHESLWPEAKGSITTIVSDSSRTPMRGSLAYGSSKTALTGVIKNMARELAPRWRVNGVSPGIIADTPMTDYIDETVPGFRGWDPVKARQYEESMIPMGRRVFKDEVANLVVSTMYGPEFMSGSIIDITGGK